MSEKVKGDIKALFAKMNNEVADIVDNALSRDTATQNIMDYLSDEITTASLGYISGLYSELSKKTLSEEIFKEPANANKFHALQLRKQLMDTYQFEITNLDSYNAGVDFHEISRLLVSAGGAVCTGAISGLLLGLLSKPLHIPLVAVIAAAVLLGLGGGAVSFYKIVPNMNKSNFLKATQKFMNSLESELISWVDGVDEFYNRKVEELKATL